MQKLSHNRTRPWCVCVFIDISGLQQHYSSYPVITESLDSLSPTYTLSAFYNFFHTNKYLTDNYVKIKIIATIHFCRYLSCWTDKRLLSCCSETWQPALWTSSSTAPPTGQKQVRPLIYCFRLSDKITTRRFHCFPLAFTSNYGHIIVRVYLK